MALLILLGHENLADGTLSATAKARCERAIELLTENPALKVLPTGAFGPFNPTATAHGELLREYLVRHGIAAERILPHTHSANTLEDALCARKIAVDLREDEIVVVTSDFHMPRVQLIFERLFADKRLEFRSAPDRLPPQLAEKTKKDEERKIERTRREWVNVPPYGPDIDFSQHPS